MASIDITTIKNALHTWVRTTSGLPASRIMWAGQNAPEPSGTDQAWILLGRLSWTNPGSDWSQFEPNPLTFTPKAVVFDAVLDQGTSVAHDLQTRDGPIQLQTTGSLAGTGLDPLTNYWVIRTAPDTLMFATSFANAHNGVAVDILGAGAGAHTIVYTAATRTAGAELTEVVRGARRFTFDIQCFPPQAVPGAYVPDSGDALVILSDVVAKLGLGSVTSALQDAGVTILNPGSPSALDGVLNAVYFEPRAIMSVVFTAVSEVYGTETIIDAVALDEDAGPHDFTLDLTVPPNTP